MCEAVPPQSLLHVCLSAQCVMQSYASHHQYGVESCASHLHHSLQLVTPHQVVALEGLVRGKE